MGHVTKSIGDAGELAVINYLESFGFLLITRNFTVHNIGELDAVMEKDGSIYVIEVKARLKDTNYASPVESISKEKIRRIIRTTNVFLSRYHLESRNVEFLAGCVEHTRDGVITSVEIVPFA